MKKTKYIYAIFLLLSSSILFHACKKELLDVEPVNEYLSSNFFITEDQVFSALVAAYDPLGWSMAYGQWISYVMFGEIRSDNANAGGDQSNNDQPGWQEFDDFTNTNTNVVIQPLYRRNYIGIFRANTVLEQTKISSATIDQYFAEAKFLRAYYHFELFKHFGPIPVVDKLLSPNDNSLQRNTMDEVFAFITQDLEEAIELLPITVSASETGRVTRGAALALLGKAYIYWADLSDDDASKFQQAADALQQIVDFGVYQLEADFQDLFAFDLRNPSESVFEVQHSNLFPSDWNWFQGIDGNGIIQLCGIRGLCTDHPDYTPGWGFMLATSSLYNHYLPDDTYRRDVTLTDEAELEAEINEAGGSCSPVINFTEVNPVDYTGFWQEKYANYNAYTGNNINGGTPELTKDGNTYVIRYAEVLLLLAEALHRGSGADGQAMSYINMVRTRAADPDGDALLTAQEVMNQQGWSLLDLIWYERRAELAMEGDRWYDLVRSGRANSNAFADEPDKASNFSDQDLWIPISLEETSVAPNLTEYPDPSLF